MELSIYGKIALLLTMSMALGGFGCWLGQKMKSILAFIVLTVLFIGGAIAVPHFAAASVAAGIVTLAVWTFISGLYLGPAIHIYAEEIGWKTVALAFFGTAGVMALCGLFATFSGINFSGLGSILGLALFGLIIAGIIRLFTKWGREADLLYSGLGMLIFSGYFIYDFFTLKNTANTWPKAIELTMKFYLDFVNFLLHLLNFILAAKHHS
jgi:FtsH-binding integral membrane protein